MQVCRLIFDGDKPYLDLWLFRKPMHYEPGRSGGAERREEPDKTTVNPVSLHVTLKIADVASLTDWLLAHG